MAKVTSIFVFISIALLCIATDAGNIVKVKDASTTGCEKGIEDISAQVTDLRKEFKKELQDLRKTVNEQAIFIQEQKRLIMQLKENSNKEISDDNQKAQFGHEIEGIAKAEGLKSERHSRTLEQVQIIKGEINTYNTHTNFTNISEKQVQEKSKEVEQKNEYIPEKTEELFDQSLRYRRATNENVAFSSYLDHELTDISHGTIIICNQILMNDGNGYNAKTGIFTAHTPGVYFFAYSIDSQVIQTNVRLLLDGTNLVDAVAQVHTMGSNMAIVRLERGQSVWLATHLLDHRQLISTSTFHMVSFSGFLIYQ